MNVERLYTICEMLISELNSTQSENRLSELSKHLQNMATQPQQAQHQDNVSKVREDLNKALSIAESNDFSPAWRQTVMELDADMLLGEKLKERIDTIFYENQMTPKVAKDQISEIEEEVSNLGVALKNLTEGLDYFEFEPEDLPEGDGEFGFLVPRDYFNNHFDEMVKELRHLNQILDTFSRVATGKVEHYELRTISTTDPLFVVGGSILVLSFFAKAIRPIIGVYKDVLDVKILRSQLAEKGVSGNALDEISKDVEAMMDKKLSEIKQELMVDCPVEKETDRNDLDNALGFALKKIANRIDRGFNFEIRLAITQQDSDDDEEAEEESEEVKVIQAAMKEMEFKNIEGKPILNLPEEIEE